MSQVAVMGLGKASGYALYEHHSEAQSWGVTVVGLSEATFDHFVACSGKPDCQYKTNEVIVIAENRVKNTGVSAGTINIKFEELDADGNPLSGGVSFGDSVGGVDVGECATLFYDESLGIGNVSKKPCDSYGMVFLNPRPIGTYYFGIKTWSDDETEPPYPSPTAALAGAEVLPVAGGEGMGLEIPVTVVSGVALVGLAMLARKRKLF